MTGKSCVSEKQALEGRQTGDCETEQENHEGYAWIGGREVLRSRVDSRIEGIMHTSTFLESPMFSTHCNVKISEMSLTRNMVVWWRCNQFHKVQHIVITITWSWTLLQKMSVVQSLKSKSKLLYDWQSVSMSWYRAPLWDLRPDITSCRNVAVWNLRSCIYWAPSLTRGRLSPL
jgi:hypothetical protein